MLILMVGVTFSCAFDTEDASAAVKKPGRTTLQKVTATGKTTVKLTWKKTKGAKGYEVYRNGGFLWNVKGTTFTDRWLESGTKYTYKVRAYTTYKQKKWFNKKTGKWQTKKPKKKFRGKSKKFTKVKYGKFSATKSVKTKGKKAPPKPITHRVTGLTYSWGEYADEQGNTYHGIDLRWNECEEADEYAVYIGGKKIGTTGDNFFYEIKVNDTVTNTFYVAVIVDDKEGPKTSLTVKPRR